MAQSGRQVAFPNASGTNKDDVGVSGEEVEFEKMFDLHAASMGPRLVSRGNSDI